MIDIREIVFALYFFLLNTDDISIIALCRVTNVYHYYHYVEEF